MTASCSAPWCGIGGKYAHPGVCNAPGGHRYAKPDASAVDLVPPVHGMTVSALIDHLALMPPDAEVVVNASDGDIEVFALVKAAEYEPTCSDVSVCRLYADQEDDDAV